MHLATILKPNFQRRHAAVFQLRLPVIFRWGEQMGHVEGGFTLNVARDAAFVVSRQCPPVGAEVRLEVLVPVPDRKTGVLRIECVGKVTSIVSQSGWRGFQLEGIFDDDRVTSVDEC